MRTAPLFPLLLALGLLGPALPAPAKNSPGETLVAQSTEVKNTRSESADADTSNTTPAALSGQVIVKAEKSGLYQKASSSSKKIATLSQFTPVDVIGRSGNWTQVRTKNGSEGYMDTQDLARSSFVSISGKVANIRSGPGASDPVKFTLKDRYPLWVLERKDTRIRVKDCDNDEGWVHEGLLSTRNYIITTAESTNFREGPSTSATRRFTAPKTCLFEVLREEDGWLLVKHADGDQGWVSAKIVWGYAAP